MQHYLYIIRHEVGPYCVATTVAGVSSHLQERGYPQAIHFGNCSEAASSSKAASRS
jgi:hypothetical protein